MRIFPLALLLAALLSGCASSPAAEQRAATPAPVLVTSLSDTDSLTNSTFMNESHQHDYWGGQSELVVMDETQDVGTTLFTPNGDAALPFRPPSGHVVPQGTDKIMVSFAWESRPATSYGSPSLWVRTPHDHDGHKVADIESGKAVTLPLTAADADVPHQQLSAWRFELHVRPSGAPPGFIRFDAPVHLVVRAHRGLDIPVLPPHPDVWNGKDAILLFDQQTIASVWEGSLPDSYNCYSPGCPNVHRAANGTVVPYDATAVEIRFREDAPSAGELNVKYHAADSWNWTKLQPTRIDGDTKVFVIRVKGLMGDGPYAAQSLWEFEPYVMGPSADGQHAGGYHITARALRVLAR